MTPERCLTCSDEAVEALVLSVDGCEASVRVRDAEEHVAIDLVPDALPGDLLLCHAGIALGRVAPHVAEHREPPAAAPARP